jgi:hypothetical protein
MTGLIVVLITAAPLVFWFLRRRTRRRGDDEHWEGRPPASKTVVDKIDTAMPEVEGFAGGPASEQTEEEPGSHSKEETEADLAPLPAEVEATALPRSDLETSAENIADLVVSADNAGAELLANYQAEPSEQFPAAASDHVLSLPSDEPSSEHEPSASSIGISSVNGEYLSVETVAAAAPVNNNDLVAEHVVSEIGIIPAAAQFSSNELSQANADVEEAQPVHPSEEPSSAETEKKPARYRPPPQRPPRQVSAPPAEQKAKPSAPTSLSLDIRVRLTFDRFGFCSIGLLPERTSALDEEIETKDGKSILGLVAQEDWYQDLQFDDIGDRLRQGFELKGLLSDDRHVRWLLSSRGIYVLAGHPKASGFVSTHRLHLGRSDVVLCIAEMLPQVEAMLVAGGCQGYSRFDESYGVPPGWVGLRGVLPTRALPLDQGSDPFYPLKAESDIQIELDGGLCLQNSVWLAGYPPQIKVLGASDEPPKVLIDGKRAEQTGEGAFRVESYDEPGQHNVYCEGLARSRSYSIEEGPESWDEWPAYHFHQADICGPLVELRDEAANRLPFAVPMSNPLLVGAEPGQIFRCSSRKATQWKGYVPFDVIWALPAQPLICNKKTARILQFGDARPTPLKAGAKTGMSWSNAILEAARKGLRIDNGSANSAECWGEYKKTARNLRRGRR